MPDRPEIVCICGSTRFAAEMSAANRELTVAGVIVVAPAVFPHAEPITDEQRTALAALHLRKIDLADRVLIVNPGGYLGESTSREIAYAHATGKPISFTDPLRPAPGLDNADMAVIGTVRDWYEDEGWGIIDSPETPGGCWAGFMLAAVPGFATFTAGQTVWLEWMTPGQDGWPYRAIRFWPHDQEPTDRSPTPPTSDGAYGSSLTLTFDTPPTPDPTP